MIFVTDAACHRIYASGEWTALTGQSIPDSLGRGWLDRVHADDRRIVMDALARAFSTASEFSIRFRVLRPDGRELWVVAGGIPSHGPPDNAFIGYLGSLTELTETAAPGLEAYANVRRFVPPPTHRSASADDKLDRIADHLIIAHSLIDTDGVRSALPALKQALAEVGFALAARMRTMPPPH